MTFAGTLPVEADARYAGRGVEAGDAGAAVFWYEPAASARYRVVSGDFAVREQDAAPASPNGVPVTGGSPVAE